MKNEILKGFCALCVTIVTLLVFSTNNASAFEVITGSVTEFAGPDDLGLDPGSTVIAVDVFGNADSTVNGVTFHTDRAGLGDGVGAEGSVTVGDVTVTTTTTHSIDNWSNGGGGPAFTGGTEGSAAALSEIMRDIRWSAAPNPISIDVSGLAGGTTYKIQLLFNEGADRNRGWDIAVNDELAVDNFSSEGGDGTWTNSNSFAYSGEFTSAADGTIAIKMQNHLGGAAQVAADGNPILQGIVINTTGPAVYSQNFDGFADGTTDLGDGSVIAGAANTVQGDRLQLTIDGQGLGFSSFSVPGLPGTQLGFTATFDYEVYDSAGANDPADGFSFNFGNAALGELGSAEEGMVGKASENLSFEVDTWRNGDAEQGVNISGVVNGADVGQLAFTNGVILEDNSRKTGSIEIRWDPSKGATFYSTGLTTNADFTNVDTGAFVGDDGYTFNISARVGGANQDLFIDNLIITAGRPALPPLPAVAIYYDFEDQEGDSVADKGANGLNGAIQRPDQLTIGGSGAPKGSTPGTGIDFQGGFLSIAGTGDAVANIVNGAGSYTASAWIKPSDLGGDKFLFGQTNQGIHNGIRSGGFLHQAHWGADTNGATNLNTLAGEWVHAAWVYDGTTDVGPI
ncbi:MAG: LamG-like jellyroll fold domain-containing protein [Verrucomicrobiota bacterium]|nr:LamG-like jellyroll fold domain-containing protein [Verrucomicrobiota bacterium]